MSDDEIRASFRGARSKSNQIKVLADLNVTGTDQVKRKLLELGEITQEEYDWWRRGRKVNEGKQKAVQNKKEQKMKEEEKELPVHRKAFFSLLDLIDLLVKAEEAGFGNSPVTVDGVKFRDMWLSMESTVHGGSDIVPVSVELKGEPIFDE